MEIKIISYNTYKKRLIVTYKNGSKLIFWGEDAVQKFKELTKE